jgi:chromosome segregation ATPase
LRDEVKSLEDQTNALKDQRASLEKEIADKNAKLQECEKDKAETKANLMKLPGM